jgi:hypothetical protein
MESLGSVFFKIDRIPYSMFDVGRSMFDVHQFLSLIRLAVFLARGSARVKLQMSMGLINNVVAGFIPA